MYIQYLSEEDLRTLVRTHFPEGPMQESIFAQIKAQESAFPSFHGLNKVSEFVWDFIFNTNFGFRGIEENVSYVTGAFSLMGFEVNLTNRGERNDHDITTGIFYSPALTLAYTPPTSMEMVFDNYLVEYQKFSELGQVEPQDPLTLKYGLLGWLNQCYRSFYEDLMNISGLRMIVGKGYPFAVSLLRNGIGIYTPILQEDDPLTASMIRDLRT